MLDLGLHHKSGWDRDKFITPTIASLLRHSPGVIVVGLLQ